MILIEYSDECLENEPGPNFYWRGNTSDYIRLVVDLHKLGESNNIEISIDTLRYIKLKNDIKINLRSSQNGKLLVKVNRNLIIIDLDVSIWRMLLEKFLLVSFYPSHEYVEFDGLDLTEDANFIISSETDCAAGSKGETRDILKAPIKTGME